MKRMLIAGALALAAAGQALAADLPPAPAPPPRAPATYVPVTAPIYNWGGVYVGINGGYGFGTSTWTFGAPCVGGCATNTISPDGVLVGGTIGANFQASQFVFGVEADADWSDITGTTSATDPVCPNCKTSNDWLGTVRGRAGYAFDRVLVFVTGGGAFGDVKATPAAASATDSTEFGWTAGGGLEYAMTENFTAKVEYLYVDLSNGSCTTACGPPPSTAAVSFTESLVRAGLNFKFNF